MTPVLYSVAPCERPLEGALALAEFLHETARESGSPVLCTSVVSGDAVVLGALQRDASVVERRGGGRRRLRRCTTGTEAAVVGKALHHLLIVPRASTLVADAHPGNFINRHVRGLLAGYNALGAQAHYFGRECFTLTRHPAGVLGVDALPGGTMVLEAIVGLDEAAPLSAVRPRAATERAPVSLNTALTAARSAWAGREPLELARGVHERMLTTWPSTPRALLVTPDQAAAVEGLAAADDARLKGLAWHRAEVPIGLLEAARGPRGVYIRGDILTSRSAVQQVERALTAPGADALAALEALAGAPFEGARASDLAELIAACLSPAGAG